MDLHLTVDLKTKTLIDLADQAHLIIEQTTKLPKRGSDSFLANR